MKTHIKTINSKGCPALDSDYSDYGGAIVRDTPPARAWEDCASCRFLHLCSTGKPEDMMPILAHAEIQLAISSAS